MSQELKYKVGDRVKVINPECTNFGETGLVIQITPLGAWSYRLALPDGEEAGWFGAEDLSRAASSPDEQDIDNAGGSDPTPKLVYIAGPMRGKPQFNFPAFDAAKIYLEANGWHTFSPADHDRANGFDPSNMDGTEDLAALGFDLRKALHADTEWITKHADAVAVLDGWEHSSGAKAEVALAHALGIPVAPVLAFESGNRIDDWVIRPETPPSGTLPDGEVRSVSTTGGEKGTKPERFDLLPVEALTKVARHYGVGAQKYAAHNWRRGYEWSKSYAALQRHANAFWMGEDTDAETGSPHMAGVAFHALTLLTFMDEQRTFDDRYTK